MPSKKRKMSRAVKKENFQLWLLCLPGIVKVLIFSYIPFVWLVMAFQFYIPRRGLFGSTWVGFQNFDYLLKSSVANRIVTNSIAINLLSIVFCTAVSVLLGLCLFEINKKWFLKISQTVVIFPYFVSWPLVGILVSSFLSERTGMITSIFDIFGDRPDFYSEPNVWWGIITFSNVWKTAGLSAVTYYAVLMGVDRQMYEAAEIDGAGRFRRMWNISMPALKLMIILNIIMSSANILRVDFNMVYYVTNNAAALYSKTDVIETYMFRALRTEGDYSIGTATGLLQALVGFVLTLGVNWLSKKLSKESLF
ncbi:MAG: sugar ABC transporter permease [Clostridia bacterium]|nr:sugar ABC transporter permease [Clostridia bacterium]